MSLDGVLAIGSEVLPFHDLGAPFGESRSSDESHFKGRQTIAMASNLLAMADKP